MGRGIDLLGQRFGLLTVVAPDASRPSGECAWRVVCDCGKSRVARGCYLRTGRTISCGCVRRRMKPRRARTQLAEASRPRAPRLPRATKPPRARATPPTPDLTGMRFGMVVAVERVAYTDRWNVVCDCGGRAVKHGRDLRRGRQRSCGCTSSLREFDLLGRRFGRLLVVGRDEGPPRRWICACDCGATVERATGNLLRWDAGCSCGCAIGEAHGESRSMSYRSWQAMKDRCSNPKNAEWANYGGRGITVCERWRASYVAFIADVGQRPSADHSIDRIDVNGHYEPENCRWATSVVQCRNKRTSRYLTVRGETMTVIEWSERTGIPPGTIGYRLRQGYSHEAAVETPLNARRGRRRKVA